MYRSIAVHGRERQNTAIVVRNHAAELERYYPRKKVICNDILGSATILPRFSFCFDGSARTSAHSSHRLASHER